MSDDFDSLDAAWKELEAFLARGLKEQKERKLTKEEQLKRDAEFVEILQRCHDRHLAATRDD